MSDEKAEGAWRDMHGTFLTNFLFWGESEPNGGVESNALLMEKAGDGLFYANDVVQDSVQAPFFYNILLHASES